MRRVLVAGVGQLGSRYIQGLANVEIDIEVWAYDISVTSLDFARARWNVATLRSQSRLFLASRITDLTGTFDLAIIASTANSRPRLVVELSRQLDIKAWLLEKVLAQSMDGLRVLEESIPSGTPAWVNTPMMTYPLYRALALKLNDVPVKAIFTGITGVACNAIHYIDLISRLRGVSVSGVNTSGLIAWAPYVKRPQFFDVEGAVDFIFSDQSTLRLIGSPVRSSEELRITIQEIGVENEIWTVLEGVGKAVSSAGNEIVAKGFCYQSEATPTLVKDILLNHPIFLPTLEESLKLHRPFLAAFLENWNLRMKNNDSSLPIT